MKSMSGMQKWWSPSTMFMRTIQQREYSCKHNYVHVRTVCKLTYTRYMKSSEYVMHIYAKIVFLEYCNTPSKYFFAKYIEEKIHDLRRNVRLGLAEFLVTFAKYFPA